MNINEGVIDSSRFSVMVRVVRGGQLIYSDRQSRQESINRSIKSNRNI